MATKISEAGSFEGWNFKTWFLRNKSTLKIVVMAVTGIIAGTQWGITQGGLVAALSKLALDAIDFYATDVKL